MSELSVRELPLFPLPEVVLFPQEVLPLHIFESRYRIMLQTVLETDSMFGVVKWDSNNKSMANVGCCAQIIKHQTADDGRSNIITLGQQRFQGRCRTGVRAARVAVAGTRPSPHGPRSRRHCGPVHPAQQRRRRSDGRRRLWPRELRRRLDAAAGEVEERGRARARAPGRRCPR